MNKPYLLIKYRMPDCFHNVYGTIEEAMTHSKDNSDMPGHAVCVYNLEKQEFILFEKLAERLEQNIFKIIKERLT